MPVTFRAAVPAASDKTSGSFFIRGSRLVASALSWLNCDASRFPTGMARLPAPDATVPGESGAELGVAAAPHMRTPRAKPLGIILLRENFPFVALSCEPEDGSAAPLAASALSTVPPEKKASVADCDGTAEAPEAISGGDEAIAESIGEAIGSTARAASSSSPSRACGVKTEPAPVLMSTSRASDTTRAPASGCRCKIKGRRNRVDLGGLLEPTLDASPSFSAGKLLDASLGLKETRCRTPLPRNTRERRDPRAESELGREGGSLRGAECTGITVSTALELTSGEVEAVRLVPATTGKGVSGATELGTAATVADRSVAGCAGGASATDVALARRSRLGTKCRSESVREACATPLPLSAGVALTPGSAASGFESAFAFGFFFLRLSLLAPPPTADAAAVGAPLGSAAPGIPTTLAHATAVSRAFSTQARPTGFSEPMCVFHLLSSNRTPVGEVSSACRSMIVDPVSPCA